MLDKRSICLLQTINEQCKEGSFQVLEIKDLISSMPKQYKVDEVTISQIIHTLKREGFIEVKYSDENVYCVCPLPKGRYLYEVRLEERRKKNKLKKIIIIMSVLYIIIALIGGFLGILIYNSILG